MLRPLWNAPNGTGQRIGPDRMTVPVLTALILIPIAVAAAVLGGWPFAGLILLAGLLMIYEGYVITEKTFILPETITQFVFLIFAVWLFQQGFALAALLAVGSGAALGTLISASFGRWHALPLFGFTYLGLAILGFIWLRELPSIGLLVVLWMLTVVWATDTCAFLVGRTLGGPKLAPHISPNKTYSGLLGGMAGAAAASTLFSLMIASPATLWFALFGFAAGSVSQVGDLLESGLKRRFGVKDSSGLVPGHGGVLDRVDGLILVVLATSALQIFWGLGMLFPPNGLAAF